MHIHKLISISELYSSTVCLAITKNLLQFEQFVKKNQGQKYNENHKIIKVKKKKHLLYVQFYNI